MLETPRLCWAVLGLPLARSAAPSSEIARPPATLPQMGASASIRDDAALAEEAKALLAQAETDVQRARAKRALWLKAWEDLLAARQAVASRDHGAAIRHAKRASELAQLG